MIFANVARLLKQSERLVVNNRLNLTNCDYLKILMSNSVGMNKPKVLITRPDIPVTGLDMLCEQCEVTLWEKPEPIPRSELLSKIHGMDALYCMLTDKIDDEILDAAGAQLKVVASMSVGTDHLDLNALTRRNIRIGYTPDVLTDATAELIVALLLATSRRLLEANKAIYKGEWKTWEPTWMCGPGLSGSTVGIVGLGRIGQRVGECLKSFNVARILYTSRTTKSKASKFHGEKVEFEELLRNSDFVVVTTALTPETRHMFNCGAFELMKRTAVFVNGSRGEVIDQNALLDALKDRTIAAAGLDVMTPEPIPLNSELLKLNNCVILPHIGSATTQTREEMSRITAKNILAVLNGTPETMPAQLKIIFNLKMPLLNKKKRAINYKSETNSEIENDINKSMCGKKNSGKLQIPSLSESEDSDVHVTTTVRKVIWSCENLKPQIHKFDSCNNFSNCSKSTADDPFRLTEKHFPSFCKSAKTEKALRNCVVCSKNDARRRSRYECQNCDVGLCIVPCFKIYHTQLYY